MSHINSVARAIKVIREIGSSEGGVLPLSDLSRRLGIPKSTLHNICRTLIEFNILRQGHDHHYALGFGIIELSHGYSHRLDVITQFHRIVPTLPLISEHTMVLAVLDGPEVVYIACRKGSSPIGVNYDVGLRLPASCTATGKALLASMSDEAVRHMFRNRPLPQNTVKSLTSVDSLLEDLHMTRERGYSVDDEETSLGMCCIGAAVESGDLESPPIAVAVSRVKLDGVIPQRQEMAAAVRDLSKRLVKPGA